MWWVMAELETGVAAFSDIEEDFFRAGDEMSSAQTGEISLVEPEPAAPSKGLWSRLFERPLHIPTDASFIAEAAPVRTRPPTERPAADEPDEEDWEWMLAAARARSRPATSPGI
jgi:hypothetical protein